MHDRFDEILLLTHDTWSDIEMTSITYGIVSVVNLVWLDELHLLSHTGKTVIMAIKM